jgi:P-type Ca2+ transporter type 2C
MSSTRRGLSFSLVNPGKGFAFARSITDFIFPFDVSDLAIMHGDLPRLHEMGGVAGLGGVLRTHLKTGLYEDEVKGATYDKRIAKFGRNVFEKPPLKTFWEHCKEQLEDPMLIILIIAGVVSLSIGASVHADDGGWVEGLAILIAVVIVTLVGAVNNLQQEHAFRQLEESTEEEKFEVYRGDARFQVYQSDIMVGDLVMLQAGAEVPADGLFVFGDDPACNEAKMTGENIDVEKNARQPFLLAGTELKRGQVGMLVTGVGINCSYGRILAALAKPPDQTPLQEKLEDVARLVGIIGAGVAVLLFLILMTRWIIDRASDEAWGDEVEDILDFFIIAVTIVVVAIPEGLPLAVTISLAYSMGKMRDDMNLVRVLSACETMGNATVICSDKTGTLTTNEMTVIKGWVAGTAFDNLMSAPTLDDDDNAHRVRDILIHSLIINSSARREKVNPRDADSRLAWVGSQTEIALLKWMEAYKLDIEAERDHCIVSKNYPFDSKKKNSSVILWVKDPSDHSQGHYRRYYKGAAEILFANSTRVIDAKGNVSDFESSRKEVSETIDRMTRTGLRSIGFSYEDLPSVETDPNDPNNLLDPAPTGAMVFVGVVGIKDPLRPESRHAVRECQRAGVIVRMVTGDHPETAKFIARECGILTGASHVVMTGPEFQKLMNGPQEEAENIIPKLRVLARSQPEDKQLLVAWLKKHGHVVAATGDGTNDAPALKEAHVGIAMNIVGTKVAKSASEIIILDDNFASIVKSVMWGRSVYDNIRKFVQFQLTVNVVALVLSLIGAIAGFENPLTAVQLLWVNLIMDSMAALALGTETPTHRLLQRLPYRRDASLISRVMWRNIFAQSALQLIILMVILFDGYEIWDVERESVKHYTLVFNTFVFLQFFNEINSRKVNNEMNVFEKFFDNAIFSGILIVTLIFQFLMIQFFGSFADTEALDIYQWLATIGLGFTSIPFGYVVRLFTMDNSDGMIDLDPDVVFEGANLHLGDDPVDISGDHFDMKENSSE